MTILNIIITFLLIFIIIAISFKNMRLYFRNLDLTKKVLQSQIDKFILMDKVEKDLSLDEKNQEGFIKFISESREQAYKYIEDSQEVIKNLILYLDKNIDYLKNNQPKDLKYKIIIKDLEKHCDKLRNFLPGDN